METLKRLLIKYPIVDIGIAITIATMPFFFGGEDTMISGAMVQAGWCTRGDDICLLSRYGLIIALILLISIIAQIVFNIYNKQTNKKKENQPQPKDEPEKKPHLTINKAARQMANYAEDFRDGFRRMNSDKLYSDEAERKINGDKTNIFLARRNNVRESFHQLRDCFDEYKDQLKYREELYDLLEELWAIFDTYSNSDKVDFWEKPTQKQLQRVDKIVKTIHQLLTDDINRNIISYEDFQRLR